MARQPRTQNGGVDPADYARIVGSTFVKREQAPLLVIGGQYWTRWTLGRLGCPHPMAAANLNRVVQQMKITSLEDLADRAQEIGMFKGLGVTAYWTVLAILRDAGFNVDKVHGEDVSYATVKHRAIREEQGAKRQRRRRNTK